MSSMQSLCMQCVHCHCAVSVLCAVFGNVQCMQYVYCVVSVVCAVCVVSVVGAICGNAQCVQCMQYV